MLVLNFNLLDYKFTFKFRLPVSSWNFYSEFQLKTILAHFCFNVLASNQMVALEAKLKLQHQTSTSNLKFKLNLQHRI